ncbi:hypothetical protein SO802_010581 [Lithocarpus litseifolius]|uniref:Zinc finger CCCH domain-containing protein 1 n=1 Tax=Lithocarpus litseifolius TaxID=425828 RepID=A0AAW2DG18_9ROSI
MVTIELKLSSLHSSSSSQAADPIYHCRPCLPPSLFTAVGSTHHPSQATDQPQTHTANQPQLSYFSSADPLQTIICYHVAAVEESTAAVAAAVALAVEESMVAAAALAVEELVAATVVATESLMADSGENQQPEQVCNFFRKPSRNKNIRKRTVDEDEEDDSKTEGSFLHSQKKTIKPDNKLYFSTGSSKNKTSTEAKEESEKPIFQFESSREIQVEHDSRATATLETETDFSRDARALRERSLKQAEEALKGKGKSSGDEKLYRGINGYTDYKAGFRREQTVASEKAGGAHGPLRASAHIRVSARFDYQPDICKDYKETGYCGYGDSCKFMHDRGDYKSGWQMEKEWDEAEKVRKRNLALGSDDEDDGGVDPGEEDDDDDSLPFACFICRQPFVDAVVTKCKHYFCEHCALKHHAKNKKCFVCNKPTLGIFNTAHEIRKRIATEDVSREICLASFSSTMMMRRRGCVNLGGGRGNWNLEGIGENSGHWQNLRHRFRGHSLADPDELCDPASEVELKAIEKKIHQVVKDAMEFAVESPIWLFLPTVSSQRMSLRIQKVLELDLIGNLDSRVQNSKGTAHAQPFKIWTSCNLLALAFSLWMHGSNPLNNALPMKDVRTRHACDTRTNWKILQADGTRSISRARVKPSFLQSRDG